MVRVQATQPSVLCVIDNIGNTGGAEQLLASLLPEMRRLGMPVEIAALYDWPDDLGAQLEQQGVPVHRLGISHHLAFSEAMAKLSNLVATRSFGIFWGHLYFGNIYAALARGQAGRGALAVTFHSEGHSMAPPSHLRGKAAVAIERFLLGEADARVAVSAAVRDDYAGYFGWSDIQVAHNGIDCATLQKAASAGPPTIRHEFGYSDDDFLVVTPARFVEKKGHRYLINAFCILRDELGRKPKLFLCGDGPLAGQLQAQVDALGLSGQVAISPTITQDRLLPLIAAADAVVLPSLREPFGLAAAEAMAIGTPCVLTTVDGFCELAGESGTAEMVPPEDPAALAAAIDRLYRQPEEARAMAERAKQRMGDQFGIAACAGRWIEILGQLDPSRPYRPGGPGPWLGKLGLSLADKLRRAGA